MALIGNAGFRYTPPGGALTTHLIQAPLREIEAAGVQRRYSAWSLDRTVREVVTVGNGVDEIVATIRYEPNPAALKAMLRHGLNDVTLTYYPDLDDPNTSYPCKLVSIEGGGAEADAVALRPDRHRYWLKEWEVRIRLRRVDGGTFDALLARQS